jgi:hypothetical protein
MQVKDGHALRSIKPNASGVYESVPLIVLGEVSRNMAYYDVNSMVDAITNPGTRFYKNLCEGQLEGEWNHPIMKPDDLQRLLTIDRSKVSHYFTKIYTKSTEDNKHVIVYGDLVPFGPFGQYLKESFEDSRRNTAFSLRSLTSEPKVVNGVQHKTVLCLITVDAVDGCGYEMASKRFMPNSGTESLIGTAMDEDMAFGIDDFVGCAAANEVIGTETITHQQVLDMLKTDEVIIRQELVGVPCQKTKSLITQDGKRSIFHALYR